MNIYCIGLEISLGPDALNQLWVAIVIENNSRNAKRLAKKGLKNHISKSKHPIGFWTEHAVAIAKTYSEPCVLSLKRVNSHFVSKLSGC